MVDHWLFLFELILIQKSLFGNNFLSKIILRFPFIKGGGHLPYLELRKNIDSLGIITPVHKGKTWLLAP